MHSRTIAVLTVLVFTFLTNSSDGHGLLRRHHKHRTSSHAANAAASPDAQNTPAAQATPPAPAAAAIKVPAAANPDIQARIKAWEEAYGITATGQRVTIKVDGKDVVLEIRVVGSSDGGTPDPPPIDDLAKLLKTAADNVSAPVRTAGLMEAAALYRDLAESVRTKGIVSKDFLVKQRDTFLALRANAKQLTASNAIIDTFLKKELQNVANDLTDVSRPSVAALLDGIAKTLLAVR